MLRPAPTIDTPPLEATGMGQLSPSEGRSKWLEISVMQILRLELPHLPGFWHRRKECSGDCFLSGEEEAWHQKLDTT